MRMITIMTTLILLTTNFGPAQTLKPTSEGIVPVVAHQPGALGSSWSTTAHITQTSGATAATVYLTVHNPDGEDWQSAVLLPAPAGAAEVRDVVGSVGAPDGLYILSWWSTHPVVLTTSTFTTEDSGTYGQGIGSLAPGSGFELDAEVIFPAPMDFAGHRVNVGIANAGGEVQVFTVDAIDAAGEIVESWTRTVPPEGIKQLRTNDAMSDVGSVAVRCTRGCDSTAFAYASVVVNDSNDAYFIYGSAQAGESEYAPVLTTRDDRGVWFITGGGLYEVYEAMGYAVTTDRLWQLEKFRRGARGTLAEIFGPGLVESDTLTRIIGYSDEELAQAFEALDVESKTIVRANVDGINRRINEVRADSSLLPFEFKAVGAQFGIDYLPEPVTVHDILALYSMGARSNDSEGVVNGRLISGQLDNAALLQALTTAYPEHGEQMFADLRWINDPAAQTMIPSQAPHASVHSPLPGVAARALPPLGTTAHNFRERMERISVSLERINANQHMGSYAWVVSGDRTVSGNPILYSGPQMGFSAPCPPVEGSIRGAGINISGMVAVGSSNVSVGRTPFFAWSLQAGHAHTTDFYLESPDDISLHHTEVVRVAGAADVVVPVYRSSHGPIIEPMPYDPANPPETIVAWKNAQRGFELQIYPHQAARVASIGDAAQLVEDMFGSLHICYADRDGNIAYWMSGRDPVRPAGVDPRFPLLGDGSQEWVPGALKPRSHDRNPAQGYYGGWNNKSNAAYDDPPNNPTYFNGVFNRAHVVEEYLASHDDLTFEQVRDLALNIATTKSANGWGGVPWSFVGEHFSAAVAADPGTERDAAVALLEAWDGHFVDGGMIEWVAGTVVADAWVLQEKWIQEVLHLTFLDELLGIGPQYYANQPLFNVLLHALDGDEASVINRYDWFQDQGNSGKPTTADGIIVQALDTVLAQLGERPWQWQRGQIEHNHEMLGTLATSPDANRSTYAQCVEMGPEGPARIESFFPVGQSGNVLMDDSGDPVFDEHFFSSHDSYNSWEHQPFPLFD